MASATAVAPPATDPTYRPPLEPAGAPPERTTSTASSAASDSGAPAAPASGRTASGHPAARKPHASRRLSVILHGKRADEADVRAAVAALRAEGVAVDVKVTWEAGDVARLVKEIVRGNTADTIVAAGGDGTLNEVVAALIKVRAPRHIAVGLLPMGTSNDFAAVTGLPQDLEGALRLCSRGDNLRPLDVGLVNGEVFMNTATLGASSELGSETSHEAKKLMGPAAYLFKGVARMVGYTAVPVRLRFPAPDPTATAAPDQLHTQPLAHQQQQEAAAGEEAAGKEAAGKEAAGPSSPASKEADAAAAAAAAPPTPHQVDGKGTVKDVKKEVMGRKGKVVEVREAVLNLTAGNSRQLASMIQACPDALLDDGLLDITYITGGAAEGASNMVGEILSRGLDDAQPTNVRMLRVPWLEVLVDAEDQGTTWPGNRDGEPVPPGRRFLLEALPRRILMHLPDSCRALLAEGADPRLNAPIISLNRARKGAFKAMLAQVTRFRRIIPGSPPWWHAAALTALSRAPSLLLAFAAGYVTASRRRGGGASGDGAADGAAAAGGTEAAEGAKGRSRVRLSLPKWPRKRVADAALA